MTDINSVVIVGNLTRDIEVRYSNAGVAVGRMSIAVNRTWKNGEQWVDDVSYFDVVLFGKLAENRRQYLTRGQKVAVQGSLVQLFLLPNFQIPCWKRSHRTKNKKYLYSI